VRPSLISAGKHGAFNASGANFSLGILGPNTYITDDFAERKTKRIEMLERARASRVRHCLLISIPERKLVSISWDHRSRSNSLNDR